MHGLTDGVDRGRRARRVAHAANLAGIVSAGALALVGERMPWQVPPILLAFYAGNLIAVRRMPTAGPGGWGVGAWTAALLLGAFLAAFGLVAIVVAPSPFSNELIELELDVLLFYLPLLFAVGTTLHALRPWRCVRPSAWFGAPLLSPAFACFLVIGVDPIADVVARWLYGPPEPPGFFASSAEHSRGEVRDVALPFAFRLWAMWVALSVARGLLLEWRERLSARPRSA